MSANSTAKSLATLAVTAAFGLTTTFAADRSTAGRDRTGNNPGPSARSGAFDLKSRTAAERKVLQALESTAELDFAGVTLEKAVADLAARHKVKIVFHAKSLDDAQVRPGELKVDVQVKGVSLKSALRIMLGRHGLDYVLRNEVLQICTIEFASEQLEAHVYDISRLKNVESKTLLEFIREAVGVWRDDGDPNGGSLTAAPGLLMIKQTQRAHEQIEDILQQLARHQGANGSGSITIVARQTKSKNADADELPSIPDGVPPGGIVRPSGFGLGTPLSGRR